MIFYTVSMDNCENFSEFSNSKVVLKEEESLIKITHK